MSINANEGNESRGNTILSVEGTGLDIEWLEPRDLEYDTMSFKLNDPERPGISSVHPRGANVSMADGSVRFLNQDISPEVLKSMLTVKKDDWRIGPPVSPSEFQPTEKQKAKKAL
jgi:prepilin-type processing-associated H-X9-DG protein